MEQNNEERASAGWLKSTGFEGAIDTTAVDYRQSPTGNRGITLFGIQAVTGGNFIGIQINFPRNVSLGPTPVPQPWPDEVEVAYFRQTSSGQRTSYRAKSGTLDLSAFDEQQGSASGTYSVQADVDGTEHSFEGSFDIFTV
ncbi:hypothetical protein LVW35_22435 [Pseudomonas sp. HN11]|uniref:hypothetical protein n=1 Tax=Pseudomonas sp. HN11 TaxID=1344094 RepID=UPI001F15FEBE|nr:hypothetical protein [Pseudomonas sp. HN11]UII70390.1 hypothetical protein LVW35_22435 [Pseudomonas sp. HN11]